MFKIGSFVEIFVKNSSNVGKIINVKIIRALENSLAGVID